MGKAFYLLSFLVKEERDLCFKSNADLLKTWFDGLLTLEDSDLTMANQR